MSTDLTKEELQRAIERLEQQKKSMESQVAVYDIQIDALKEKLKKAK